MEDFTLEDSIRSYLRNYIEENGIVAGHVADTIGIPRSALSNFLKKRGETFKLSTLVAICKVINLEVNLELREHS